MPLHRLILPRPQVRESESQVKVDLIRGTFFTCEQRSAPSSDTREITALPRAASKFNAVQKTREVSNKSPPAHSCQKTHVSLTMSDNQSINFTHSNFTSHHHEEHPQPALDVSTLLLVLLGFLVYCTVALVCMNHFGKMRRYLNGDGSTPLPPAISGGSSSRNRRTHGEESGGNASNSRVSSENIAKAKNLRLTYIRKNMIVRKWQAPDHDTDDEDDDENDAEKECKEADDIVVEGEQELHNHDPKEHMRSNGTLSTQSIISDLDISKRVDDVDLEAGVGNSDSDDKSSTLEEGKGEECAICLGGFHLNQEFCVATSSVCKHVFHKECMEEWLMCHDVCPVCRENYLAKPN